MNTLLEALKELKNTPIREGIEDNDNISDEEYLEEARRFADEIKSSFTKEQAKDVYAEYEFDKHGPEDTAETYIYNALCDVLNMDNDITEDFESSKPIQVLPRQAVYDFIAAVKPGEFFHVGYAKELGPEILSKFKGGRGSVNRETGEIAPRVRILKCTEFYGSTGTDYENKGATQTMRAETGKERHGNLYQYDMGDMPNKIGVTASGAELLQLFPRATSKPKVKYFISINDGDLREASREELVQYLTPTHGRLLMNGREEAAEPTGADVVRLNLTKIYWIGNLGHSIF